jgi:hypothetical protein
MSNAIGISIRPLARQMKDFRVGTRVVVDG